jgi:hypothetical protein
MWVVIVFTAIMSIIAFEMLKDSIVYKDYPISSEYWIAGLLLIGFLGSMIGMILI